MDTTTNDLARRSPARPFDRVAPAIAFLVGLAFFAACVSPTPAPIDTGFNANAALRIARGDVPYRDFFSLITPLTFFLNAAVVRVFGNSLHALGLSGAVVLATAYATIYAIAREFLPTGWAIAAWLVAMPFSAVLYGVETAYSMTAALFAFAAILQVIRAIRREQPWRFAVAGLMIGLSFWSKQTVGGYVGLSLTILFACRIRRPGTPRAVGLAASGFLVPTAIFVAYLLLHGAWGAFVQDCFVTPFRYFAAEARVPPPSPRQFSLRRGGFDPLVYYIAIGAVAITIVGLARQWRQRAVDPALLYLAIASACLLLITLERYSLENLLCVVPPTFVLWARSMYCLATGDRRSRVIALAMMVATLLYCAAGLRYASSRWDWRDVAAYEGRIAFARRIFAEHRSERVAVLPASPLHYFTANGANPTRFDLALPGNLSPADRAELAEALATRVDYVLFDETRIDGRLFRDYQPAIADALDRYFEPVDRSPQGQVLLGRRGRKDEPR